MYTGKTLRECLKDAAAQGTAIGHFNISNLEALHGIYQAARKADVPVIIGVSEGEEAFVGLEEAVALVSTLRNRDQYPIFLNADHHGSFESVKRCIDAGFDAVIIDAAKLPFDENAALTLQCVEYARAVTAQTGRDILVEAELGYIGSGSNIKDKIPDGAGVKTDPEEAKKFVTETGVDLLAPSIGSIHGIIKSGKPHIDAELTKHISGMTGVPLVLHGGSGLRDEDFTNAIRAGVRIVHINSEIRLAYRDALKVALEAHPDEIAPAKLLQPAVDAIAEVVYQRLMLFTNKA
ncbi:MAG: class II fructose-bisphosphate aldolase family protein [Candidatus Pacebacteria bacterium]|nr:class II fructose-bisphosphate aldolase family protein [Candidatus Paceibacterota bacterium]